MDIPRALLAARDITSGSWLLTLVGVGLVITGLYFGRPVLIPLALAGVFAFLLTPMVELLEKCHLGRVFSVLLVLIVFVALLAAVGWGATNQLMQIMVRLPDYRTNIHNKIQAIRAPSSGRLSTATEAVNNLSKELSAAAEPAATNKPGRNEGKEPLAVQVATPARNASEYLRDLIGPLTGILETTGIVLIFTLFILMKREDLRNRFLRLAGSGQLNVMTQAMDDASKRLSRYLWLQFLVNLGYGLLFGLGVYASVCAIRSSTPKACVLPPALSRPEARLPLARASNAPVCTGPFKAPMPSSLSAAQNSVVVFKTSGSADQNAGPHDPSLSWGAPVEETGHLACGWPIVDRRCNGRLCPDRRWRSPGPGFQIVVPADCVAALTDREHRRSLDVMKNSLDADTTSSLRLNLERLRK